MSFLAVAGTRLRIRRQPTYKWVRPGMVGRNFYNRPGMRWNREVRVWSFEQVDFPEHMSDTWEGLLHGRGHHWSFDADPWSESGVGPQPGSTFSMTSGGAQLGAGYLTVTAGNHIEFDARLRVDRWSVCYWRNSSAWEHVIVRSDGAKWLDGTRNDALSTAELTVSNGIVRFDGAIEVDDLTVFAFHCAEIFLENFYSWTNSGNAGPPMPEFDVYGDWLEDASPVRVVGKLATQRYKSRWNPDGNFRNNYRSLGVELFEV